MERKRNEKLAQISHPESRPIARSGLFYRLWQTDISGDHPCWEHAQQIEQLTQQYGSDRVFIEQYSVFLLLFLPGLTLLGIYGTIGIRRSDNPIGILPKIVMVLILLTNVITALNSLAVASKAIVLSPPAFWLFLVIAALGLANFAFCLVIWNGYKWGMWAFAIAAFLMFILKFAGSVPIIPSLFELSTVVVLFILIRPVWSEMD